MSIFYDPTVRIDGQVVSIVPGTVVTSAGFGEAKTLVGSTGGGNVDVHPVEDVSTKMGKAKFEVYPTAVSDKLISKSARNRGRVTIDLTETAQDGSKLEQRYEKMTLTNDPETTRSADGKVSLEFSGAPVIA